MKNRKFAKNLQDYEDNSEEESSNSGYNNIKKRRNRYDNDKEDSVFRKGTPDLFQQMKEKPTKD